MPQYRIIWGSPDAGTDGLYYGDELVASAYTLYLHGYDYLRIMHWSQKALGQVADNVRSYR